MTDALTPDTITPLFTRDDGSFLFARWGRPVAPIVFGVEDETLALVKGALEAVIGMAGHKMAETDPELGANLMVFFFREWRELTEVPDLDRLIDGLGPLVARLETAGANQYRAFRFDDTGAIKAAFVFLRMDDSLMEMAAEDLALAQAAQVALLWSEGAFRDRSPLVAVGERVILRPDIAAIIRAAYDPVLPPMTGDASHALRLYARIMAESAAVQAQEDEAEG